MLLRPDGPRIQQQQQADNQRQWRERQKRLEGLAAGGTGAGGIEPLAGQHAIGAGQVGPLQQLRQGQQPGLAAPGAGPFQSAWETLQRQQQQQQPAPPPLVPPYVAPLQARGPRVGGQFVAPEDPVPFPLGQRHVRIT
ncbi:hypothetical protein ABPG75_008374 [Micractinium tetrahymenae]